MSRNSARLGDICTGHGCFPSRNCITASTDVIINRRGAHRVGDQWSVHRCSDDSHGGTTITGSNKVLVNGMPLARVGDVVSCGSSVMTGSDNVVAG